MTFRTIEKCRAAGNKRSSLHIATWMMVGRLLWHHLCLSVGESELAADAFCSNHASSCPGTVSPAACHSVTSHLARYKAC